MKPQPSLIIGIGDTRRAYYGKVPRSARPLRHGALQAFERTIPRGTVRALDKLVPTAIATGPLDKPVVVSTPEEFVRRYARKP